MMFIIIISNVHVIGVNHYELIKFEKLKSTTMLSQKIKTNLQNLKIGVLIWDSAKIVPKHVKYIYSKRKFNYILDDAIILSDIYIYTSY